MRMPRRMLAAVAAAAMLGSLAGCAPSGDGFAASLAERIAVGIADDITPIYDPGHDAEYVAYVATFSPRTPQLQTETDYGIDAMSWEGDSREETGASFVVRIRVHVSEYHSGGLGQPDYDEGRATECWRIWVTAVRNYDNMALDRVDCPEGPAPALDPVIPAYPTDVEALLTAAMEGATAGDIDERVRTAFPEEFYSIESKESDGELAVALGIPEMLDCAIGARTTDGTIRVYQGFDDAVLQEGESGCDPDLFFHPIVTH